MFAALLGRLRAAWRAWWWVEYEVSGVWLLRPRWEPLVSARIRLRRWVYDRRRYEWGSYAWGGNAWPYADVRPGRYADDDLPF